MRKKDSTLILVILLLLGGLYFLRPPATRPATTPAVSNGSESLSSWKKIENSIDKHMKLGRRSEELGRDLTSVENQLQAPAIDNAKVDPLAGDFSEPIPLKLNGDDAATKAYRDVIEGRQPRNPNALTPDQRITNKLNRDRWEREYRGAYEKEYVRAYIENAKKAGYEVKLNEKGEIDEVVDIGTNEPVRFPQSVDESGKKATPGGGK